MNNLTGRGARRAAAKEAWRALTGTRTQGFVDFWRSQNDEQRDQRFALDRKRTAARRRAAEEEAK